LKRTIEKKRHPHNTAGKKIINKTANKTVFKFSVIIIVVWEILIKIMLCIFIQYRRDKALPESFWHGNFLK
jgi:hypothetical protein